VIAPARKAAYDVIRRVFEEEAYADRALASAVEGLDPRDRALAQRLAYGTVQRARTSDFGIEQLGKRPVRKLDGPVKAALRLGAYQLAFTDQAEHAVVNDTVELVRAAKLERAVAFTNAVMRRLAQGFNGLVASLPEGPVKESYPDWIAETWTRDFGNETALALMRAQNEPPETAVRIVATGETRVVDRIDPGEIERGEVWPQSRGSQLAGAAVDVQPGERVLDLCAAPGGKTTQLANLAEEVVAVELHPGRARELDETVRRLGFSNIRVVNADARELPAELDGFDRVLVDAPCSGLGVLAARPDLRWRAKPLPELQTELLRVAAERVKPEGAVVYSVCTIAKSENEKVVDAAVSDQVNRLALDHSLAETWPEYEHPHMVGGLLTLPHRHRTSGFFIARLIRMA
jgi:16S rRNA (cytosine967-C5)-methyltransferase